MKAYLGNADLKVRFIQELEKHAVADAIIQGVYERQSDNAVHFRGCSIGCSLHAIAKVTGVKKVDYSDHSRYEDLLGIPRILARLSDRIFEGLPEADAKIFPLYFAQAIPVGADLSMVWSQFAVPMLIDPEHGVLKFARTDQTRKAIQDVADLYKRRLAGDEPAIEEWRAADAAAAYAASAYAAYAAAAYAAYAAAAYDAAYAADAADAAAAYAASAYAADAADAYAAAAAAAYAADAYADAAKKQHYVWFRDLLLSLLASAPIAEAVHAE